MSKHYLTEDVRQIQKYFPGARAVALHTPFDLTEQPVAGRQTGIVTDPFRDNEPDQHWYGDLAWNR